MINFEKEKVDMYHPDHLFWGAIIRHLDLDSRIWGVNLRTLLEKHQSPFPSKKSPSVERASIAHESVDRDRSKWIPKDFCLISWRRVKKTT